MKTKILSALKEKYKTIGFSEKAFQTVADFLSNRITEDDQIEAGIDGLAPMLKAFQADADKRVNGVLETLKSKQPDSEVNPENDEDEDPENEDPEEDDEPAEEAEPAEPAAKKKKEESIPSWAQSLIRKIEQIESGSNVRQRKLEAKLQNLPDRVKETTLMGFKYAKFDSEEEFDAYLSGIDELSHKIELDSVTANKPIYGSSVSTRPSSAVQNFIESRNKGTGGELAGKDI